MKSEEASEIKGGKHTTQKTTVRSSKNFQMGEDWMIRVWVQVSISAQPLC